MIGTWVLLIVILFLLAHYTVIGAHALSGLVSGWARHTFITTVGDPVKLVSPMAQGPEVAYADEKLNIRVVKPVSETVVKSEDSVVKENLITQPTELEEIVAYIARRFEPEGKGVVVRAINCFYSESGLRSNAVGQNSDGPKSKDHGVAQLNDYWHKLTQAEKTDYRANIDRAYEIYKGNGHTFNPWYGKGCR